LSPSHAGPDPAWTRRQREVLDLLVRGRTNPEIAEALGISLDGAKWHVSEVITKLGVDSRDEAAEYWRAHNGLRLRFTRILHGLIASTWLKVGGGIAVVGGASVAIAVVVVALHNSGPSQVGVVATPPATTTPASAVATTTPAPPSPDGYPLSRSTGVQEVENILAALASGNIFRIQPLLSETPSPCVVDPQQIANPPRCPAGVPAGTALPVFRASACESVWPEDLLNPLAFWFGRSQLVYAVYRQPQAVRWLPAAEYAVVFNDVAPGGWASSILITGGKIVGWDFGCGQPPTKLLSSVSASQYIVAPPQ